MTITARRPDVQGQTLLHQLHFSISQLSVLPCFLSGPEYTFPSSIKSARGSKWTPLSSALRNSGINFHGLLNRTQAVHGMSELTAQVTKARTLLLRCPLPSAFHPILTHFSATGWLQKEKCLKHKEHLSTVHLYPRALVILISAFSFSSCFYWWI